MALAVFDFESQYLHMNTKVGVILPNLPHGMDPRTFYGQKEKKYKVLWLLHGTYGDFSDWIRKSKIELYAAKHELIVVMPSALNSNYTNWSSFAQGFYMDDFLIKELMPLVRAYFPASQKREDNFIAGLSMGGNGALKYAIDYPECFAAAAVLSSTARDYSEAFFEAERQKGKSRFDNLVRNFGGMENFLNSDVNIRKRIDVLAEQGRLQSLPRLFFAYGDLDHGYAGFLKFLEYAKDRKLLFTYEIIPGYRHEWRFWDLAIQDALHFFGIGAPTDRKDTWKESF